MQDLWIIATIWLVVGFVLTLIVAYDTNIAHWLVLPLVLPLVMAIMGAGLFLVFMVSVALALIRRFWFL